MTILGPVRNPGSQAMKPLGNPKVKSLLRRFYRDFTERGDEKDYDHQ
jgi:hypothetical protein